MSETGHEVQKLAAQIAAGSITYDLITDEYGGDMASSVMAFVGGGVAESVVGSTYDVAREIPVVGDVLDVSAGVVGDIAEGFMDLF